MRWILALVLAAGLVQAQEDAARAGIEAVIRDQMQAFSEDDVERAFGFAAQGIRDVFGTSERFGAMVRNGYPMVYRPGEVRFGELREVAGKLWQKVLIRDAAGVVHVLDYELLQTDLGWRIGAVILLRQGQAGA